MKEPRKHNPTQGAQSAANALRLPPGALPQLHNVLDIASSPSPSADQPAVGRRFRRWVYRDRAIPARVEHLGGSVVECEVAPRDLSCTGIGLLHNGFFHAGTIVTLTLHSLDHEPVHVKGIVRWCRHTIRQIHESGIEFVQPIDPRNFLRLDNSVDSLIYESVAPEELAGSVLHVEPNSAERKLLAHMVRQSNLSVVGVGTLAEAVAAINTSHFDVVIAEADFDDGSAIELLTALADKGLRTPVIVLTALSMPALRHAFTDAGVQPALLLSKPFDENLLLCASAQVLLAGMITGQATGPIRSRLVTDDSIAELVRDFVDSLHKDAAQLTALISEGSVASVKRLVHMLRSSGASYGFEPVSTAAAAVEDALQGEVASLDSVRAELNRLIEVLRRCMAG